MLTVETFNEHKTYIQHNLKKYIELYANLNGIRLSKKKCSLALDKLIKKNKLEDVLNNSEFLYDIYETNDDRDIRLDDTNNENKVITNLLAMYIVEYLDTSYYGYELEE